MRPARWSSGFLALFASLLLVPLAAVGVPPQKMAICHFSSQNAPEAERWVRIEVGAGALEGHLAHGDALPGETVPGPAGSVTLDDSCVAEAAESPPPENPPPPADSSERVFAVAYADADPDDGGYNASVDVLIAKLIDGPGEAGDGLPGPGDLIQTSNYPMDFGPSAFGEFAVTEHTVVDLNVGMLYVCNVDAAGGIFVWSSGQGEFDLYQEYDASIATSVRVNDGKISGSDEIFISTSSPSQPLDPVATMSTWDPTDQTFIDVEADCSG